MPEGKVLIVYVKLSMMLLSAGALLLKSPRCLLGRVRRRSFNVLSDEVRRLIASIFVLGYRPAVHVPCSMRVPVPDE